VFVYVYFGVIAGIFGLAVGSFLNVVIYRIPARLSVIKPRSRCPSCETDIAWYDNVPVLSYLALRGRCRHCGVRISPRYALVELLTCVVALVVYWQVVPGVDLHHLEPSLGGASTVVAMPAEVRWQDLLTWLYFFTFFAGMIAVFFIDLEHYIVPNQITYLLIPLGLVGSLGLWYAGGNAAPPVQTLLGVAGGGGSLLAVALAGRWLFGRDAMGMGDVKLLATIGAFLGAWPALLVVLLLSSIGGSVVGITLRVLGRSRTSEPLDPEEKAAREQDDAEEPGTEEGPVFHYIPYGPFLVIAALAYFLIGDWLLGLYATTLY
jgi:leader peptidase (prepilin peptidase) / N-methyltransferase